MIGRAGWLAFPGLLALLSVSLGTAHALAQLGRLEDPPVLSYHQVVPDDRPLERGFPVIHVSDFEGDLRWLADHGIRTLTLTEYLEAIAQPNPPRDAVLLTVDDGYESVYTLMRPLLQEYGMNMVAFVITGRVGKQNTVNPHQPWLTWAECLELEQTGVVEIESHSHAGHGTVPGLRLGLPKDGPFFVTRMCNAAAGTVETQEDYRKRIREDLTAARQEIQAHLGRPARALAWPFGVSNQTAEAAAKEAGYAVTFTLSQESRPGTRMRLAMPQYWEKIASALATDGETSAPTRTTQSGSTPPATETSGAVGSEVSGTPSTGGSGSEPLPGSILGLGFRAALGALLTGAVLFAVICYIVIRGSNVRNRSDHSQVENPKSKI